MHNVSVKQNGKIMMKKVLTLLLQTFIVLMGIVTLIILIWFPLTEVRATNLDLLSIYADPFILYGYATSIAFFVALYKAFKLLGYIGQNKLYSLQAVRALKSIKHCAFILAGLIAAAGLYINLFHHTDDDPAGFLAMCIVFIFASVVVATVAAIVEKLLQDE
jgi:hypothetical protein